MENKTRGRYVLFTIALDLPAFEDKETAEMRGYNWLARRLTPRDASRSGAVELLSFKTVSVDSQQLRDAPQVQEENVLRQTYGYLIRLHGDFSAGDPAPAWLVQRLSAAGDGGVRFRGITEARAALLTGRPG